MASLTTSTFLRSHFLSSNADDASNTFPDSRNFSRIANVTHGRSPWKGSSTACATKDVERFPRDYSEVLKQAQLATKSALSAGMKLLEVEFPTSGLDSVSGDGEGGIEMTESAEFVRKYCRIFQDSKQTTKTRIFFPDFNDMVLAKESSFEDSDFQLDYLTKPSGFEDIGFTNKVTIKDRVKEEDEIFVAAYPYFNVNEILAVEELYKDVCEATSKPIIVVNGELDRIRSGYYPSFFYPKLGKLGKFFLPKFETVYYIHNFKGRTGGKLFRVYPGPWQVLRGNEAAGLELIHTQASMPTLKEVSLNILGL